MNVKIYAILYYEDSPVKNTTLKMIRAGIALSISKRGVRGCPVVLNPFSQTYHGPWLRDQVIKHGILVIDASWKKLTIDKFKGIKGIHVKLPPLLPGNPINYGKPCILSSIEAVAAALYITSFKEEYNRLIGLYKWMKTFNDLNHEILEEYSKAQSHDDLLKIINEYWGFENPCYQFVIE